MDDHADDCSFYTEESSYPTCDCELKMEFPPDPFITMIFNMVDELNGEGA